MRHYAQTVPGNFTLCEALFVEFLSVHMTCHEAFLCTGMQLLKQQFVFFIAAPKLKKYNRCGACYKVIFRIRYFRVLQT